MGEKKPLRVLVVEDSEFDAALLVNVLRRGGYAVTWKRVERPEEMQAALASQPWDFVFSDHEMPHFSAPAALQLLQASGLDLPFIIVSGGIGEETAVAAMKAGAHDFVMKGNLGRLVPAVDRELREAANRAGRRRAETALQESERRYRLLWETSPDAVVLMDAAGKMQFVNPAAEEIFGFDANRMLGRNLMELLPERMPEGTQRGLSCVWEPDAGRRRRHMFETLGRRQDQSEFPIEIGFSNVELMGAGWFVAFIRDVTERKARERMLREKQEQFRVAHEIQQRLFPATAPVVPGFEIAGASYPAEETGGDYFDFLPLLGGGLGLVVGDVTGHGIGPALLMAEARAYLRIVGMNRESVSEVLVRVNRALAEDVGSDRFVTVLLVRLDAARRLLTFGNAGHPAGYVFDAAGRVKAALKRTGPPLGVTADAGYPDVPTLTLAPGDLLLLLTDGIEEALNAEDEQFGVERVFEVVRQQRQRSAGELVEALRAAVQDFTQHRTQEDDITVVVLKCVE